MNTNMKICVVGLLCLVFSGVGFAYDVYVGGIPDVDKQPLPPNAGDQSCWQAAAANLLAAGGWGLPGNTAQQNADLIYGHMTNHFGKANQGDVELAIGWWLYSYGYNSSNPGGWYRPTLTYNDQTVVSHQLVSADYDHLLNELNRGQYVAVKWSFSSGDHAMTLVGGDKSTTANNKSVWHDSDRDVGNGGMGDPNDDAYANAFEPWTLIGYPANPGTASGYVTLCPGVQKPASAMNNYDAAYYRDQDQNGNVFKVWRIAGINNYGNPTWQQDNNNKWTILQVPNEPIEEMHKEVYLLVDFKGQGYTSQNAPDIILRDENGTECTNRVITVDSDGGQILYHWTMDDQPPLEYITFPDESYYNLSGDVLSFNVATECVPEPITLSLLLLGIAGIIKGKK